MRGLDPDSAALLRGQRRLQRVPGGGRAGEGRRPWDRTTSGLIWYDPKTVGDLSALAPPTSWDALQQLITTTRPRPPRRGASGVESGAASGWPGTDWIEDLVLRQAGPDVYNHWWQGKTKWSDPAIKTAFQTFGDVVANELRRRQRRQRDQLRATRATRCSRPRPAASSCTRRASSPASAASRRPRAGTDYNFFPFPDINPQYTGAVEGAGDLFGMFHNTPAAGLADGVPRDRPGPGHLGQGRRRAVRQQERHRLPGRHQQALGGDAAERQDLRLRRVGPDAQRHERRLLDGHRRRT